MNMPSIRRARLALLIKDRFDGSQAKFVELTGENQGEVSALLRDKSFGEKKARKIELKCNLPMGWLDLPLNASGRPGSISEAELPPGKWVSIDGIATGGHDGVILVEPCPPGEDDWSIYSLSSDPKAYSLRVRGDGMRPRIKHAEYIIVEPGNKAEPGDDALVRQKDGAMLAKELLWTRDDEYCLGSINNSSPPVTLLRAEIDCIHRIAAIVPRGSTLLRKSGDSQFSS